MQNVLILYAGFISIQFLNVSEKVPCLRRGTEGTCCIFEHNFTVYFFDSLVMLNSLLLVVEFHLEDTYGTKWAACNNGVISLCWIQVGLCFSCCLPVS